MDNLRDGINKIGKSLENKAEDALNRMEDELDNLQDEPVPVYPTGKNLFKPQFVAKGSIKIITILFRTADCYRINWWYNHWCDSRKSF